MTTTMVVTQPQPVMISRESQEWSSGICDCTQDVPECCFAFWCLPCFTCITAKKYGECLCLPLLDYIGFGGCIPAVTMSMRVSMRQRYGIQARTRLYWAFRKNQIEKGIRYGTEPQILASHEGTMCKDCAYATFCLPCVWCQMSREMKTRNIQIVMVGAKHTNPPAVHYSKRYPAEDQL